MVKGTKAPRSTRTAKDDSDDEKLVSPQKDKESEEGLSSDEAKTSTKTSKAPKAEARKRRPGSGKPADVVINEAPVSEKRVRKMVTRFGFESAPASSPSKSRTAKTPEARQSKKKLVLSEIDSVKAAVSSMDASLSKKLHQCLYKSEGDEATRKEHILSWSGCSDREKSRLKTFLEKLSKTEQTSLKKVFPLTSIKGKASDQLASFLSHPETEDSTSNKASNKRKRGSSSSQDRDGSSEEQQDNEDEEDEEDEEEEEEEKNDTEVVKSTSPKSKKARVARGGDDSQMEDAKGEDKKEEDDMEEDEKKDDDKNEEAKADDKKEEKEDDKKEEKEVDKKEEENEVEEQKDEKVENSESMVDSTVPMDVSHVVEAPVTEDPMEDAPHESSPKRDSVPPVECLTPERSDTHCAPSTESPQTAQSGSSPFVETERRQEESTQADSVTPTIVRRLDEWPHQSCTPQERTSSQGGESVDLQNVEFPPRVNPELACEQTGPSPVDVPPPPPAYSAPVVLSPLSSVPSFENSPQSLLPPPQEPTMPTESVSTPLGSVDSITEEGELSRSEGGAVEFQSPSVDLKKDMQEGVKESVDQASASL